VNKDLYNQVWDFPEHMRNHMVVCFKKVPNADSNVEGFNRNKRLQKTTQLSYPELKRIKNFFDSFSGPQTDAPFILNGGPKMKDFVNGILSGARQSLQTSKEIRKNSSAIDKDMNDLPKVNNSMNIAHDDAKKKTIEKYDLQVTEHLRRINNLMQKLL
jgi:hypothetical protein